LRNGNSSIVLADNGSIGLSGQNINLYAGVDIGLIAAGNLNLRADGDNIHLSGYKIILENPIQPGSDYIAIESGVLSSRSLSESGSSNLN
jgi:hypothetical protein